MGSSRSTMVELSTTDPEIEGSNSADTRHQGPVELKYLMNLKYFCIVMVLVTVGHFHISGGKIDV
jgi:hypothetical protein